MSQLTEERVVTTPRVHAVLRVLGHSAEAIEIAAKATLHDVAAHGARLGGFALLPPNARPFDRLHSMRGDDVGPVIENLEQTVEEFLQTQGGEPHFGLELTRTLRVNTRWDIAPKEEMTPREILGLPRIHLNPEEYSLYRPESTELLPLDTPVKVERGSDFEAQRDGRYGR